MTYYLRCRCGMEITWVRTRNGAGPGRCTCGSAMWTVVKPYPALDDEAYPPARFRYTPPPSRPSYRPRYGPRLSR